MSFRDEEWFSCPHCGEQLRDTASFCASCGASEDSGWPSDEEFDTDSETDEDDDYDDFIRREFPDKYELRSASAWKKFAWVIVVLIVLLLFQSLFW